MRERLYLVLVDADLSGANSSPFGPLQPTRRADWLRPRLGSSHRIYGLFRVGPKREGSQVALSNLDRTTTTESWFASLLFLRVDL